MDASKLESALSLLGLWKAVKGYPALLVLVIFSIILLEMTAPQALLLLPGLSASALQLLMIIIGTLLGLTGYFAGDFWNSRFFDPRYGVRGKWLDLATRPYDVFPAGSDLKQYRGKAIHALLGKEHNGEGIYREAKKIAMKREKQWGYIEQPLVLSKFVRGFIWPCFLLSVSSILGAVGSIIFSWGLNITTLIITGVVIFCFGVLLFIPYFQLRVDHMIRLYEYVYEYASKKQPSFLPFNVEEGLRDTISDINKILSRPREASRGKQDEMLVKLHQQLEIILIIVTKLEDLFIELLRSYRNQEILQNQDALKSLVDQTRVFLESQKLLHYLDPGIGAIETTAISPRFEGADYAEMVAGLGSLCEKLQAYRRNLGENQFETGPGFLQLKHLRRLAEEQLNTSATLGPTIAEFAKQAPDQYDWQLSSDIRKLIGSVSMNT